MICDELRAEEFLLKLLLKKRHIHHLANNLYRLGHPEITYKTESNTWTIQYYLPAPPSPRKPVTALHTMKLRIAVMEFEKLLDNLGIDKQRISAQHGITTYLLWYGGDAIGRYQYA